MKGDCVRFAIFFLLLVLSPASALAHWASVRSGANGCAVAVGDGVTDDQAAIQCQATFLKSTFGGGILYFPPGTYLVGSTVTLGGGTFIQGVGPSISNMRVNTDITGLAFDTTASYAGMDMFEVFGNQGSAATQNLVTVGNGALVNFSNCFLDGGLNALATNGVDGNVSNCTMRGYGSSGGNVLSQGANTYYNARLDQSASVAYAFKQGVAYNGTSTMENRISSSDFSGNYINSLVVADTNNLAVIYVTSSVFSSPISITGARFIGLIGDEIGANVTTNSKAVVVGAQANSPVTISGTGAISCEANDANVTCPRPTVTKTVRSAANTGSCTLIFTGGILTGGTC